MIMNAGVAVLNENVYEALKGFYKMRKAYQTLDAIADSERTYLSQHEDELKAAGVNIEKMMGSTGNDDHAVHQQDQIGAHAKEDNSDDEFFDADDSGAAQDQPEYQGHVEDISGVVKDAANLSVNGPSQTSSEAPPPISSRLHPEADPAIQSLITHPIDLFIHSGTSLHYGIILLMLSMIPPAFSRLLSMIGFRGDRERGLAMLWRATAVRSNINGCVAALVLLGYYNGLISYLDILPPATYPKTRCDALLHDMRTEHPKSRFWYLQAARTRASMKDVEGAVAMLEAVESEPCGFRQVEALQWFEKSLNLMSIHDYPKTAASFQKCVEMSKWSHGLYHYITACAHIELYRYHTSTSGSVKRLVAPIDGLTPDAAQAAHHKEKAMYHLTERVPNHMAKKKFMGRQLPFDTFVLRKLAKWRERAAARGCDLIDAVGVSPLEEQIFFWGGFARMRPAQLHRSLLQLGWSDGGAGELLPEVRAHALAEPPGWDTEAIDERAMLTLLRAHIYRQLRQTRLTRAVLAENPPMAPGTPPDAFRGGNKDNWTAPISRYELAVAAWIEAGGSTGADAHHVDLSVEAERHAEEQRKGGLGKAYDQEKLRECLRLLEEAAGWESFDLDARFGIKITTGRDTIGKFLKT